MKHFTMGLYDTHFSALSVLKRTDYRPWLGYGVVLMFGVLLDVLCRYFPADLPFWMPWQFSWPTYLMATLSLGWFTVGYLRLAPTDRAAHWRNACFVVGVLGDYTVLQTHIDYLAQHMFFVHRWAQFVLHHAGGFLIAMGTAGPTMRAGMPQFLLQIIDARPTKRTIDVLQHPVVAPLLFVGMLYFWLIPQIQTWVMLDIDLYNIMNWSMAINGIFFWCLILDPRPNPPARVSSFVRAMLIVAIELPQMVLGAILSLSATDYYPVYSICGRIMDITALTDQHYGGLIIWLPGTLTSLAAMIVVLNALRINDEKAEITNTHLAH